MVNCPFSPEELARYAAVAVGRCFDLRPGELLLISYEHEHRPLAIAVAEVAYQRGLRVDSYVNDPLMLRAEIERASAAVLGELTPWQRARAVDRTAPGTAFLSIDGQAEPDALA